MGHSNRPLADFLAMLRAHGIKLLVDVRTHPGSRAVPWANPEPLAQALAQEGIRYLHIPALGGRRKPLPGSVNTAWRNEQFRGYADHMATPEFKQGLEQLLERAAAAPTAVMCAEAVPWRCHRSLLADALVAQGVEVVQAIDSAHAAPHKVTPFARIRGGQVTYPAERPLA
ncbi:MAG TPA: DUF488 domain-containing protein [Candidatus Thermoplasmatota archaeon]|nr:DUF488 domain-containing protein [Candidatus Thermoplasmatota archaeon]